MHIVIHTLLLFKFFTYYFLKMLLWGHTMHNILILIALIIVGYYLNKYPKTRFRKLSTYRQYHQNRLAKFALKTQTQQIYNLIVLWCAFFLFVIVVLYLRFSNAAKIFDLAQYYNQILNTIQKMAWLDICLKGLIFAGIFMIYLQLMHKMIKYVKFHIIKRHIFLVGNVVESEQDEAYQMVIFHQFLYKVCLDKSKLIFVVNYLYDNLYFKYQCKNYGPHYETLPFSEKSVIMMRSPVDPMSFSIKYTKLVNALWIIITKGHYVLLLILLAYDLYYCNLQITKIFYVLPWLLFYDIYIRVSKFVYDINLPYDEYIHKVIYATKVEVLKDDLLIDGEFYDLQHFKEIYQTYIKNDFIYTPF